MHDTCPLSLKSVTEATSIHIERGQAYHLESFSCHLCELPLVGKSKSIEWSNAVPFCKTCTRRSEDGSLVLIPGRGGQVEQSPANEAKETALPPPTESMSPKTHLSRETSQCSPEKNVQDERLSCLDTEPQSSTSQGPQGSWASLRLLLLCNEWCPRKQQKTSCVPPFQQKPGRMRMNKLIWRFSRLTQHFAAPPRDANYVTNTFVM